MDQRGRLRLLVALSFLTAILVAGCGGGEPEDEASAPAPTATTSAARPAPAPRADTCHRLAFAAATEPVDDRPPVPCAQPHTSVTVAVGTVDPVVDGHLVAIDSHTVQEQLARTCPARMAAYLGGDETTRRLSMFRAVWFGPSVEQADLGARWFRCDAVAVAADEQLAELDGDLRGVLADADALDRYGTCGTAAPSAARFERVICARPHRWRAVDIVEFPAGTRFQGGPAGAAADDRCKAIASQRADGALKFSWSFQWPTREQWDAGQHYGYCWLPTD